MKPRFIALLTDFGLSDPYVAIMKGVLSGISPGHHLIDITHLIPPGDIQRGAFVLWQSMLDFPRDSIFLAVVDPGVGTERKAICLECGGLFFIGPDNGLFSYITIKEQHQAWELSNLKYQLTTISTTFHGRDIFAPAAAHIANGVTCSQFGPPIEVLKKLPPPKLLLEGNTISGEIISEDQFGNLFTTIGQIRSTSEKEKVFESWTDNTNQVINNTEVQIHVQGQSLMLVESFGMISKNTCAAIIGSTGLVEIICNQGSASDQLGLRIGDPVTLSWMVS